MIRLNLLQGVAIYSLLILIQFEVHSQNSTWFDIKDCISGTEIKTFTIFNRSGDVLISIIGRLDYSHILENGELINTVLIEAIGYPRQLVHIDTSTNIICLKPLEIVLEEVNLSNSFSAKELLKDLIGSNFHKKMLIDTGYYDFEYNMMGLDSSGQESLSGVIAIAWNDYLKGKWSNAFYVNVKYSYDSIFVYSPNYESLDHNRIQQFINYNIIRNPKKLLKSINNKKSIVSIDKNQNNSETIAFIYQPHNYDKVFYNMLFNRQDSCTKNINDVVRVSDFFIRGLRCENRTNNVTYSSEYPLLIESIHVKEEYMKQERDGIRIDFKLKMISDKDKISKFINRKKLSVSMASNFNFYQKYQDLFEK